MRRTVVMCFVGTVISLLLFPSWATAQEGVDCASTYEGHEATVGGQVQLEDGSWIEVTDPNVCMGESLEHAAQSAQEEGGGGSSAASSETGSATDPTVSGSQTAVSPQGGVGTGFGGMADPTGVPFLLLMGGGLGATLLGAAFARRRSA